MRTAQSLPLWQRHLYPLLAGLGLLAWAIAHGLGGREDLVVLASSGLVIGLSVMLERRWPHRRQWQQAIEEDTRRVDLPSALVVVALVEPLLKSALPLLVLVLGAALPHLALLWPVEAPWMLQWLLALLISELARYAVHRAHHESPLLWRLHALHHGAERLYWLNNFRIHPLNLLLAHLAALLPLRLAGAPEDLLLAVLAFTQPVVLMQHANIELHSGRWNAIFSTNQAHRWHHSKLPEEAHANYGSALLIWDHVFGSYRASPGLAAPGRIGWFGKGTIHPARASYWRQLLPFAPACCRL